MGFLFGGPSRRGMRGGGRGPRGFWGPPPPMNMGMGYYPRRRRFYNAGRNSLFGGLALGALGYAAGKFFGGRGGNGGGFGGPGPGGMGGSGSGGSDWGGGNDGPGFGSGGGSFDAGGGSDWN